MFDYVFAEQNMPFVQCPDCNYKAKDLNGAKRMAIAFAEAVS